MLKYLLVLLISSSAFAAESSPAPLKLSPFPNGLEYKPTPEPSNTGNPLLSDTRKIPGKKKTRPDVKVHGAANGGGGVGAIKTPIGTF